MLYSQEELKSLVAEMNNLLEKNQVKRQKQQREISASILRTTRIDKDTLDELTDKLLDAAYTEKKKKTAALLSDAAYAIIKLAAANRGQ